MLLHCTQCGSDFHFSLDTVFGDEPTLLCIDCRTKQNEQRDAMEIDRMVNEGGPDHPPLAA